jgi:hypothetical protein
VPDDAPAAGLQPPAEIDTTVPHSARVWNYLLGGEHNFPIDREFGDRIRAAFPDVVDVARASRAFLARAIGYLAGEAGIRQFLDVGTGLPTADNTHQIAQRHAPDSRVVYVDNDPLVLARSGALLAGTPEGATAYLHADLREPDAILAGAARTLDFDRPVAVMMMGVLGHIGDLDEAYAIVNRLVGALPSGSHLVINDGTNVIRGEARDEASRTYEDSGGVPYHPRTPAQIARFFDGLELVAPGVVSCTRWRPDPVPAVPPAELDEFCGVGRKP